MTTRLCFVAAYQCSSPYKSTELQMYKRHTASLGVLIRKQCVTALLDEKQAVGRSSSSAQSSAATHLESVKDGLLRAESEEAQSQVRLQDLRIGCIYKGKVSVIESYGVFVDIGAYTDGFIHISRLGRSFVRRVEDVVQVGQQVSVQIVDLDLLTNIISLLLRPEEGFSESVGVRPLTLSEHEVVNRAAATRANKLARRVAGNPLPSRRAMRLETRQRLKAYRRAVLAERQAIQLHQARSKARNANDLKGFSSTDELHEVLKAKC